jgi:hypothetical protein
MYESFDIALWLPIGCNELYMSKALTSLRNLVVFSFERFRGDVGELSYSRSRRTNVRRIVS